MSSTAQSVTPIQETESPSIEIDLLDHQDEELFDREHALIFVCGGRGSGKSYIDFAHFFTRSDIAKDQPYGLFANTDTQLQTFVSQITERCDEIGRKWVYGTQAPKSWRRRWKREGIRTPAFRKRNLKFLIIEDGTHIFTCSMVGNAYTRAKSLDLLFALVEEATEPGVTKNAITTILGCVRCGVARKGEDGISECERRGHFHQMVVKFNVPLEQNNYIYKYYDELRAKEEKRRTEGKRPFFRMIESSTRDNPHTGEEYDERLRAAMDANTYQSQTSGKLIRNVAGLSYYSFSDMNILPLKPAAGGIGLAYSNTRELHMYFDFNPAPAAVGWGHDVRCDEVRCDSPSKTHHHFGVVGELFSGEDTFVTEQVAPALLLDPGKNPDGPCGDCRCEMSRHMKTGSGWLCRHCAFETPEGNYCSGVAETFDRDTQSKYIKAPSNWHGLMQHRGKIFIYGDASGRANSSQAREPGGNIQILRKIFGANLGERVFFRFRDANPPVSLRLIAMNRALEAGNKVRSLFVGEWCEAHIADFRGVIPDPKTGDPLKVAKSPSSRRSGDDYWLRTDISDALGYMVDYRWPFRREQVDMFGGGYVGGGGNLGPLETNWPRPG